MKTGTEEGDDADPWFYFSVSSPPREMTRGELNGMSVLYWYYQVCLEDGTTCCESQWLDNPGDDFERGNLDVYSGANLGRQID